MEPNRMDTNDVPLRRVSPPLAAADQSQNAVGSSEHHQPLSSSSIMQVMNQPLSPVHSPQSNAAHLVDSLFLPSFDGVPAPESHTDNDDDFLDLEQIMMCAMEEGEEHQAEDTAKSEVMSIVNKMVGDATMDLLNDKVTVVNHKYTNSYEELSDQEDFKVPSAPTSTVPKEAVPDGTSKQDKRSNTPRVSSPNNGRWKKEEHALFLEALNQHGKNWQKISAHVKTRTAVQSRTHAQKYYQKLAKMEKAKEGKKDGKKGTGEVKTKAAASGGAKKIGIGSVPKRKMSEIAVKKVAPKPTSVLAHVDHPPPTMYAAKTQVIPSVSHAVHYNITPTTFAKAYEQAYARGFAQGAAAAAANAEQPSNMASFPSYVSQDSSTDDVAICNNTQYGAPQAPDDSQQEEMGPATKRMKAEEENNEVVPICVSSIYLPQDSA